MSMTPREKAVYEMSLAGAAAFGALIALRESGDIPREVAYEVDAIIAEYERAKAVVYAIDAEGSAPGGGLHFSAEHQDGTVTHYGLRR